MSFRKTNIRSTWGLVAGVALASLLAVAAGSFLLEDPSPKAPQQAASTSTKPNRDQVRPKAPEAERPELARVRALRALETHQLVALAQAEPDEAQTVLNVLWGRGARSEARALAKSQPTLTSKLAALESRDSR